MLDLNLNYMFVIMSRCIDDSLKVKKFCNINEKGADFRCVLWGISREEAVNRLNNSVSEDKGVL